MIVRINLKNQMKKNNLTNLDLANIVGITPANMSRIATGKTREISFDMLAKLCKALKCNVGDILEFVSDEKPKVIPLFLDYSGTTDRLLNGGAENVKAFFDAIIDLQNKSNSQVQCYMVTASSYESARTKFALLDILASNYGLTDLFKGAVAEYCGYLIRREKTINLFPMDPRVLNNRQEIAAIAEDFGAHINDAVSTFYNVVFQRRIKGNDVERDITREDLIRFKERIQELINDDEIETRLYFDDYGIEADIAPTRHNKATAVETVSNILMENYEVPIIIIGGDDQEEDLKMYKYNKDKLPNSVFVAPSSIGTLSSSDNRVYVSDWENSNGITDCIRQLTQNIRDDGGISSE